MSLKTFITESNLSQEDKDLWFSMLEGLNEEQVKILEDFIGGKEENLKKLTENFKAKRKALEDLDEKALGEIVETEK